MDLPEIIGGKYRPRSVLGLGATGTVYCVEHTFTGDLLALKVLQPHLSASPEAIARFKGEARTAAKLRSRHVVRIFDADVARELGGAPYLVMELLEGSNLDQAAHEKVVEPATVVSWFRQAAVPLERAHGLGIVHRDLKPENLFLTKLDDGASILKILDFGIARIAESPGMTKSGQLFGTPLYMAPEQARGAPDQIGPATDIFALGLIAYRLLTGTEYRTESGLASMLNEILNDALKTPSERGFSLGEGFDRWFLRACDQDPSRRFASVREQVDALAEAFGLPAESNAGGQPPSSGGWDEVARSSWVPVESGGERASGAPSSLRATTLDRSATKSLKLDAIPTLSGSDVEDLQPRRNGWRLGFFAVSLLALAALIELLLLRTEAPAAAAARSPLACPSSPAVTTREDLPSSANPTASVAAPSSAETAKAPTTAMRANGAEMARVLPIRAVATPTPSARKRADDDPLSDQK